MSGVRSSNADEALAQTHVAGGSPSPAAVAVRTNEAGAEGLAGTEIDHFFVERKLGYGGMGQVYVARDRSLERLVALKVLKDELGSSVEQEERFLREARAQAKLNHPNVVHIYYIGRRPAAERAAKETPGRLGPLYFAMELVEGESLEARIDRGERLGAEEARRAMLQVALGLREALRMGIIHRDVKPSNLLRDRDGNIRIADFGLAKPLRSDASITQDGAIVGSPLYMAPEQAKGGTIDHRADMYCLGATFFHLLAGRPPFQGENSLSVVAKHLTEAPPKLRALAPSVPEPLARIIDGLLEKEPDSRTASYDALIAALEAAAPSAREPAGFIVRGAATALDVMFAAGLVWLLGWPGVVLHLVHVAVGTTLFGQTLGKFLLRLEVTSLDGARLEVGRSIARLGLSLWFPLLASATIALTEGIGELRTIAEQLQPSQASQLKGLVVAAALNGGLLTLMYAGGLLIAALHPQKRALHDLLVGSVVRYRLERHQ